MTSDEAREAVKTLLDEKRKDAYIKESRDLLIFTGKGGLRRTEPHQRSRVEIFHDNRKRKTP